MKKYILLFAALSLTLGAMAKPLPHPKSSAVVMDRMVAIVNNDVITEKELDAAVKNTMRMAKKNNMHLPAPRALRKIILNQLINQQLIVQLAKRQGITVSDKEIDARIQLILKNKHWSKTRLMQDVKASGMSKIQFRKTLHDQILSEQVRKQALSNKISISEEKVNALYAAYQKNPRYATKYHVIDILVAVPASASTPVKKAKRRKALNIATHLKQDASFDYVADGDDNDLGWRSASEIPEIFAVRVVKMKKGDVAGPIEADNGFHVIRLEGIRRSAERAPSKQDIRNQMRMHAIQKALQDWMQTLRKQAYIKVNL